MRTAYLLLALMAAGVAIAQRPAPGRAAESFHEAAGLFVAGDTVAAERAARAGLAAAPGDPALEALLAAIKRRAPPRPNSGSGQDERRPPQNDEGREENEGTSNEDEPPPQSSGDRSPEDRESDTGPNDDGRPSAPPGEQQDVAGAARPRMTRAEAEALLRALGADERRLLRARAGQVEPREVENEW